MHLLVATPAYPHNGNPIQGLFNEEHALALKDRGWEITVVVCKPRIPGPVAGLVPRYRDLRGLHGRETRRGIEILFARYLHIPGYYLPAVTANSCSRAVSRALERSGRSGFDVLQVHSVWPVGLGAPSLAAKLRIPFVVTLHIEDDRALYASSAGRALYKDTMKRAAALVAVGSPMLRFIRGVMPDVNLAKLSKIPNGIALDRMPGVPERTAGGSSAPVRIVSVCNLWRLKGIDLNLRALARLNEKGIRGWDYSVVGGGPEKQQLARLAFELGIGGRVRFCGKLAHEDALRRIGEADVFSMPSRSESFGMVYLEAMAYGKPVVGCRDTGAEDLVVHGATGLLVAKEDIGQLAEALERLITDEALARRLGAAARLRAAEFTWPKTARQYEAVYTEAIGNRTRRGTGKEAP